MNHTAEKSVASFKRLREYSIVFVLILFVAVMQILQPKFLSPANIGSVLLSTSGAGIVAIGAMMVLISGGLDFSAGYGVALCGVVGGVFYEQTGSPILMLLACILCGAAIGLVNGLIITKMQIQPFIATLAMMSAIQGLIYIVCEGKVIFLDDSITSFLGQGTVFGFIPVQIFVFLAMVLVAHFITTYFVERGMRPPATKGEIARCILNSLSAKCARLIRNLEETTGNVYGGIYIGGGGIKNKTFCQCLQQASKKDVVCVAPEITVLGNLLSQLIAQREIRAEEGGDLLIQSIM